MEVWVLEAYNSEDNYSEVLQVFENLDVGMDSINILNQGYTWKVYDNMSIAESNDNINIIYYLHKREVVLDEMPNNKLFK